MDYAVFNLWNGKYGVESKLQGISNGVLLKFKLSLEKYSKTVGFAFLVVAAHAFIRNSILCIKNNIYIYSVFYQYKWQLFVWMIVQFPNLLISWPPSLKSMIPLLREILEDCQFCLHQYKSCKFSEIFSHTLQVLLTVNFHCHINFTANDVKF